MLIAKAQRAEDLNAVTSALHDRWVDLDRMTRSGSSIMFPCYTSIRDRGDKKPDLLLRVGRASGIAVNDSEKIGFYDINEIIYKDKKIKIIFNIPLDVSIDVDCVDVEVSRI